MIDLDGTLVDTLADFTLALSHMAADLGLPAPEPAWVVAAIGKGSAHLVQQVLEQLLARPGAHARGGELTHADVPAHALKLYLRHYGRINGQLARVYPGAATALESMRAQGWPLVCVTNKPTAAAESLLARTGLAAHFVAVYGGDTFARSKPDPLPLLSACATLGLPPQAVLMLGDSGNDAQAARAAGCPVVLLRHGYNHGRPVDDEASDAVCDDWHHLIATLRLAPACP